MQGTFNPTHTQGWVRVELLGNRVSKALTLIWYRALTLNFFPLELPAHAFRALESCRHAGKGLPCCPVTSSGSSGAANGRAGEEYQAKARYQIRANALLTLNPVNTHRHTHDAHTHQ